jgi:sigma-E factor negative regulatory protein RseC
MAAESSVCHEGTVIKTDETTVFVRIEASSACAACKAKSMCNLTDVQEKVIEAGKAGTSTFKPGENVTVFMHRALGTRALWLGYLIPFVIVIIALFLFSELTGDELQAGLISLILLLPYYLGLYLFRNKLKKTFTFEVRKSNG